MLIQRHWRRRSKSATSSWPDKGNMPWDRKRLLGYAETIQIILGVTDKNNYRCNRLVHVCKQLRSGAVGLHLSLYWCPCTDSYRPCDNYQIPICSEVNIRVVSLLNLHGWVFTGQCMRYSSYTKCINVIIDSIGLLIILRSICVLIVCKQRLPFEHPSWRKQLW